MLFLCLLLAPLLAGALAAVPDPPNLPVTEPSTGGVGAKKFATAIDCGNVIAFSSVAAKTSGGASSPAKLLFSRDLTDKGIGWSRDDGEFTCYCPGLYQFAFAGTK